MDLALLIMMVLVRHVMQYLPLIVLVSVAAVSDIRSRRIPNWLTLTLALAGLAQSVTPLRVTTPSEAWIGLVVGFVLTFLLYAVGGRGAGDVKLTAGIGAWLGPKPVLYVFAAAALISLVVALVQSTAQGKLLALLKNTGLMLLNVLNIRRLGATHVIDTGMRYRSIDKPMPNAVMILIATVGVIVWVAGS